MGLQFYTLLRKRSTVFLNKKKPESLQGTLEDDPDFHLYQGGTDSSKPRGPLNQFHCHSSSSSKHYRVIAMLLSLVIPYGR